MTIPCVPMMTGRVVNTPVSGPARRESISLESVDIACTPLGRYGSRLPFKRSELAEPFSQGLPLGIKAIREVAANLVEEDLDIEVFRLPGFRIDL